MKRLNLYSKIEDTDKKDIIRVSNSALRWCIRNFRGNTSKNRKSLKLRFNWKKEKWSGEYIYKSNTIYVFPNGQRNMRDVIDTVIHEFIHHKQCMKQYKKLLKRKGYQDHPMEQEAIWFAKMYRTACWLSIKEQINK
jgi:hypothetical protein